MPLAFVFKVTGFKLLGSGVSGLRISGFRVRDFRVSGLGFRDFRLGHGCAASA